MTRDELLGSDESAFMDEETARTVREMKARVVETEQPVRYQVSPAFPERGEYTFHTVRYPHYDEEGNLDGTVAICRNVTDRKERERQLQVIDRVLRHNLRNAMNAVEGFAEKIRQSGSEEAAAYAGRIVDVSERLSRTVDKERKITDFLSDLPRNEPLDVVPHLEAVVSEARDRHPDASIETAFPGECRVTATVAVRQAVEELLENAIVHSDRDRPSVTVRVEGETTTARVVVADDGPGIPEMERKVLTRKEVEPLYHGSGLGLWLVNLIVQHSNGALTFTENDPRGSVVTIRLPAA